MKKILVVEDNIDLAENIALLLKEYGYNVISAYDGKNGLELIIQDKPDLIICDIMLPDINGYKLLSEIRKFESAILPIFIFLTAKTQRQDLRKGMTLGADDYITKPFTYEELLKAVETQFKKREKFSAASFTNNTQKGKTKFLKTGKADEPDSDTARFDYGDYVFINDKKNPGFYLIREIIAIKSLKDYTRIYYSDNKRFLLRKPMIFWEAKLPKDTFIRIHRQVIVNVSYIEKTETISSNRFVLTIKNLSEKLEVSQRFSKKIKKIIE